MSLSTSRLTTAATARRFLENVAPRLDGLSHKGQGGRIAVLGGSKDYTGAPYFAGMSALRAGAELVYVLTADEAATAIKSYSPELMVTPVYNAGSGRGLGGRSGNSGRRDPNETASSMVEAVEAMMERIHTLVIGPGLGRDPRVLSSVADVIAAARRRELPLVLDADALWLIAKQPDLVRGYRRCTMLPNKPEYDRLLACMADADQSSAAIASPSATPPRHRERNTLASAGGGGMRAARQSGAGGGGTRGGPARIERRRSSLDTIGGGQGNQGGQATAAARDDGANRPSTNATARGRGVDQQAGNGEASASPDEDSGVAQLEALCAWFEGVTIVRKGRVDLISNGTSTVACDTAGTPRRCGGIGDVLAGCTAAVSAWVECKRVEQAKDAELTAAAAATHRSVGNSIGTGNDDEDDDDDDDEIGRGAGSHEDDDGQSDTSTPDGEPTHRSQEPDDRGDGDKEQETDLNGVEAAAAACYIVRLSCAEAFTRHRRGMLASDVLTALPDAFEATCPAEGAS